jgi:hypothetical protein
LVKRVNPADLKKKSKQSCFDQFFFSKKLTSEFLGNIEVLNNHHQSLSRLMEPLNTKKIYFDGYK